MFVAVIQDSIPCGPAVGDEIVDVLPKGTRLNVLDKKHGLIRIADNRRISNRLF